jgi:hypothetical protein
MQALKKVHRATTEAGVTELGTADNLLNAAGKSCGARGRLALLAQNPTRQKKTAKDYERSYGAHGLKILLNMIPSSLILELNT